VLHAGAVSVAFLVAVFLAHLPEAIAATTALSRAGRTSSRIMRFWLLVYASPRTVAIVLAFAGGAILTMLVCVNCGGAGQSRASLERSRAKRAGPKRLPGRETRLLLQEGVGGLGAPTPSVLSGA
jgi:hypothetical protein